MTKRYRSSHWKEYRLRLIDIVGGKCEKCGRSKESGAILQVHHRKYVKHRMPWEYDFDQCEVLCKLCHAEEHGLVPPQSDWELICQDDLGDVTGKCDSCGTELRYTFMIIHQMWNPMEVGELCCDRLTGSFEASLYMQSVRNFNSKKKRFVQSSRWKEDVNGNSIISQKGLKATIVNNSMAFQLNINGKNGKINFPNQDRAKMHLFDIIESGELEKYFLKK